MTWVFAGLAGVAQADVDSCDLKQASPVADEHIVDAGEEQNRCFMHRGRGS